MGELIDGRWSQDDARGRSGVFRREASRFDGARRAALRARLPAEPGRFVLIASETCPWSHRVRIVRALRGLDGVLPVHIAHGARREGYALDDGRPWPVPGTYRAIVHLHELYTLAEPAYSGRVTVPVLWDARTSRIVSNESVDLLEALDTVAPPSGRPDFTLLPENLRGAIGELNARLHRDLNDAVYQAGMTRETAAREEARARLAAVLDALEARLADRRFLFGAVLTQSDVRACVTLARWDVVYFPLFEAGDRPLRAYPNLWRYARDLRDVLGPAAGIDAAANRSASALHDVVRAPIAPCAGQAALVDEASGAAPIDAERFGTAVVMLRDGGVADLADVLGPSATAS